MSEKNPPFISLKIRAAVLVAAISVLISGGVYITASNQLNSQLNTTTKRKIVERQSQFDYQLNAGFDNLFLVAEQIRTLLSSSKHIDEFVQRMEESWDELEFRTDLSGFNLYQPDSNSYLLALGEVGELKLPDNIQKAMVSGEVQRNIICRRKCFLVITSPNIGDNGYVLQVFKSLNIVVLGFAELSNTQVALLDRKSSKLDAATRSIWDYKVRTQNFADSMQDKFAVLANQHPAPKPGRYLTLSFADKVFEISLLTTRFAQQLALLVIEDVTETQLIHRRLEKEILLISLTSIALFSLTVFVVGLRLVKRLKLLHKSFEMIAEHRFKDAKRFLRALRPKTLDEIDLTIRATAGLTDKLQLLDNELQKKREKLEYQALHDELTGLGNRNMLLLTLEGVIADVQKHPRSWGVAYVDLDNFKYVNDSMGHFAGDALLKAVAQRLQGAVRNYDTVCRIGGDEFAIIFWEMHEDKDVHIVMKRIFESLANPVHIEARNINVSLSAGVSLARKNLIDASDLLKQADIALYAAKEQGKNRFCVYNEEMARSSNRIFLVENEFEQALYNDEFELLLQPQLSIADQRLTGFEALVRWRRQDADLITPDQFISVLEKSDKINQLGRWVARHAIDHLAKLSKHCEGLTMAINLSPRQLTDREFLPLLIDACRAANIEHHQIEIEITESLLVHDIVLAERWINKAKELGFRIAIDDFGTGFSSLSYLGRFAFDVIKLDRSFLTQAEKSARSQQMLITIITLAKKLNSEVLAEGVETRQQLNLLRESGCQTAQGYLFTKPISLQQTLTELRLYQYLGHWPVIDE